MAVVIANARQAVVAPVRTARRFGLFSVVDPVDGGDGHWLMGGLRADGEQCSKPNIGTILCGPTAPKSSRSWYSDINGDPWLTFMYETCKTVGRVDESAGKLRTRFLAAEQSAAEAGLQANVLNGAVSVGAASTTVAAAIGALEAEAAKEYGGQVILHLPFTVAAEAGRFNLLQRQGDHLETVAGNLVSVGNYLAAADGGSAAIPVLYATGTIALYRGDLVEAGPVVDRTTNDYFVLVERGYAALIDCFSMKATATLCGC
jgi:hypothetical protein